MCLSRVKVIEKGKVRVMVSQGEKIPVYCAYDEEIAISELKPNPRNPNTHPKEQIELLAKIIKKTGWRSPITVSTLSGMIVKGHGRLMAADIKLNKNIVIRVSGA